MFGCYHDSSQGNFVCSMERCKTILRVASKSIWALYHTHIARVFQHEGCVWRLSGLSVILASVVNSVFQA